MEEEEEELAKEETELEEQPLSQPVTEAQEPEEEEEELLSPPPPPGEETFQPDNVQPLGTESTAQLSHLKNFLFLVEFLIDTVMIDPCCVDREVLEGETCVTVCFLNFPPMEICRKGEDSAKDRCGSKVRFNSGKSLMFALELEKFKNNPPTLLLEIKVFKKLTVEDKPMKMEMGVIKICISELYRRIAYDLINDLESLPTSKSIKDCFMLIGPGKRTMGEVCVYIRLSCLGQTVVTEFFCPLQNSKPISFRNRRGRRVFEFTENQTSDDDDDDDEDECRDRCLDAVCPDNQKYQQGQGDSGKENCCNNGRIVAKNNHAVLEKVNVTNPDENYFVLRVGDKGQIPDRGKMILEFRTPKQKIAPKVIPPYHEEVAIQTDSTKKKGKRKKK